MKAYEIINSLFSLAQDVDYSNSCDTCKSGDPDVDVTKVAVTLMATVDVIRKAKEWGAQLLITHEPTYYNHLDTLAEEKIQNEKRRLIEASGMTVYRFHDHPHLTLPDMIAMGEFEQLGLEGRIEYTDTGSPVRLYLETPITPVELAKMIEEKFGIQHVRITGARNIPCKIISGMFGQPSPQRIFDEFQNERCDVVLVGEVREWMVSEYVRDMAALGYKAAMLVLGHVGSERAGMQYTAKLLKNMHPELEVQYYECEEVYSYTSV